MSPDPVRIGLVGYGSGGRFFHSPLLSSAAGCVFAGVVTRSAERRELLAAEHPATQAYESLSAMAADVDAVTICTPAATHAALALQALDLGLAVVCDKPFALDASDARRVVERAESAGLILSVYQNRRWDSDFLTVRKLIADGALGEITVFESRFERFAPARGPKESGGGTLLDFGAHLVDQALQLFGPVDTVYGELRPRADRDGLDDDVFAALVHQSGVRSHLFGSHSAGDPRRRFLVSGTTGAYVVAGMDCQESALLAGLSPASEGELWGLEIQERWGEIRRGKEPVEVVPTERGRWDTYYPAFAAAVQGQGQVPVDPRDSLAAMQILDAVRLSATQRRVVDLADAPV
jgi:predicted dehydrogenase